MSYGGKHEFVCAYILGYAVGEERAFALAVDRTTRAKRRAQARWICLRLSNIEDVRIVDEPWIEQDYPARYNDVSIRCTWKQGDMARDHLALGRP